ncbi:MAG: hypothetical protein R3F30_05850 [Planctomycetota bacterium]
MERRQTGGTTGGRGLRGSAGGYAGTLIGVCGWLIGLMVFLLVEGRGDLMVEVLPIGLGASLALGLVLLVTCELLLRLEGRPGPMWRRGLMAGIALTTGVLLFLAEATILPALRDDPQLRRAFERLGSVTGFPTWLSALLLFVAVALYADVLRRVLRAGGAAPGGDPAS